VTRTCNLKKEILLTIAKAGDFDKIKKKFPDLSDSFIKNVLIEAADSFGKGGRVSPKRMVVKKVNTPLTVYVDGASKGNPGVSAAGVAIMDECGNIVAKVKKYLGVMTNNKAEYNALIIGLRAVLRINSKPVTIFMDSELVVKQIKGQYKVKNAELSILNSSAQNLLKKFDGYNINHIVRSKNTLADSLANEAIKEHMLSE
jgi:ribonuclease HI